MPALRILGCLVYPAAEAEANYYRQLASQTIEALVRLRPNRLRESGRFTWDRFCAP